MSTQLSVDKCAFYCFLVTHTQVFLIDKSFKPISFSVLLTHSQSSYLQKKQMANEGLPNTKAIRMDLSPEHTLQYSNPGPVSCGMWFLGSPQPRFFADMCQGGQKGASVKRWVWESCSRATGQTDTPVGAWAFTGQRISIARKSTSTQQKEICL